ncbi:hypothetical protein ACFQ2B_33940 [Streptomyces stramineus]
MPVPRKPPAARRRRASRSTRRHWSGRCSRWTASATAWCCRPAATRTAADVLAVPARQSAVEQAEKELRRTAAHPGRVPRLVAVSELPRTPRAPWTSRHWSGSRGSTPLSVSAGGKLWPRCPASTP